jgi:HAE1 family hydrophobic/amphiphilic exporter-1
MRLALLINYKVIVQASLRYRATEDILKLYVKNDRDEMVPYSLYELEKSIIWTLGDY